jgi:hypothetical protein
VQGSWGQQQIQQQHSSMATSQGLVNWKIVDAELERVPQDFKDPKFYALKHVVEILTSSNPQGMVAQVSSSWVQKQ